MSDTKESQSHGVVNSAEVGEVCLVQMPYGSSVRPSLALGVLESYLTQAKIRSSVHYPIFDFIERIGLDTYYWLENSYDSDLLGEWTFAGAAFPEFEPDHESYFRSVSGALNSTVLKWMARVHPGLDVSELLFDLRAQAVAFVDETAKKVLATRPSMVGCSSLFQQHCASLALLRRIKELAGDDVITLLGGANCEGPMGRAAHRCFPWVDFVVSGEADVAFVPLVKAIARKGKDLLPEEMPPSIWGPCHRSEQAAESGSVSVPVAPELVRDMDATAIPSYGAYFEQFSRFAYHEDIATGLPFETSRGCWWGEKSHCTFCGLNGHQMTYRSKSSERVISELDELSKTYNTRRLNAVDNILDLRQLKTVFPEITGDKTKDYLMFWEVKSNLKRSQMEVLRAGGVRWLQAGIESLHPKALDAISKGCNPMMNLMLLKWGRELGIRISWNMLVSIPGVPDECYGEMADWLALVHHLEAPQGTTPIRFDRFSPYQQQQDRYGLKLSPYPQYASVYPVEGADLEELAYFFVDEDALPLSRVSERPGWSRLAKEIHEWFGTFIQEKPVLCMEERDGKVFIRDTRKVAVREEHCLEGAEALVYQACDSAPKVRGLQALIQRRFEQDLPRTEIESIVQSLLESKLLLDWGGSLLALATDGLQDYPDPKLAPWGYADLNSWSAKHKAASLGAAHAYRPPTRVAG